jgi:hypothetical protein
MSQGREAFGLRVYINRQTGPVNSTTRSCAKSRVGGLSIPTAV